MCKYFTLLQQFIVGMNLYFQMYRDNSVTSATESLGTLFKPFRKKFSLCILSSVWPHKEDAYTSLPYAKTLL